MNKVILTGRLTREPEVRYSQGTNPMAVARYTLAVERKYKKAGESEADFISCISFGKTAEFVEKYLKKGTKVIAVGSIRTGSYTNKDGQQVYTTDVVVDDLEFAESKSASNSNNASTNANNGSSSQYSDGFMNIPDGIDETLPFN